MYIWGRSDSLGYVPHGHIGSPRIHFAAGMPQALAGGPAGSRRRRDRHSPEEQQEHVGRAATARLSPAKAQGRPAAAPTGGRLCYPNANPKPHGQQLRGRQAHQKKPGPRKPRSKKTPAQETPRSKKPPHLASQVHPKWRKVGPLSRSLGAKVPAQKTSRLRTQSTCTWLQCPGGTIRDSANAPDAPHHALLWNDGEISPASPHRL